MKIENENPTFTPTEKMIYSIWCDILKIKDILKTDNFFNKGGYSLLAVKAFNKIKAAFNVDDLEMRVFFDSPRIEDLAEAIDILLIKKKYSIQKYPIPEKGIGTYKTI